MNTSESDLINKTFYPGWLMVSQLRCGQPVTDGEALYRQACRWVTEAREALTAGESVKPALSRCSMPTARCWMRASSTAPVRMMATAGGARIRCRRAFQHSQRRGRALGTDPPAAARAHGGCGSADLLLSYFATGVCRTVPRRG